MVSEFELIMANALAWGALFRRLITPDIPSQLALGQPHRRIRCEFQERGMKLFRGRMVAFEKLVTDPENAMHLNLSALCQYAQNRVAGKQDTAGMSFR